MYLAIIIVVLAVISIGWAVWSLKELEKNDGISREVKKELSSSRVVYHAPEKSYDSSSSSSEV